MRFQTPLVPATLIRRYKRFLADCLLEDGREVTAHVANPGSMLGLKDEGLKIWLEPNDDPKRKLKYAWRLVEHQSGAFTGVDTGVPNRMLRAALEAGGGEDGGCGKRRGQRKSQRGADRGFRFRRQDAHAPAFRAGALNHH